MPCPLRSRAGARAPFGRLDRFALGDKFSVELGELAPLVLAKRRRIPNEGPEPQVPGTRALGIGDGGVEARQLVRRRVTVTDGSQETTIEKMTQDPLVRYVMVRDGSAGCYGFRVERQEAS